MEKLMRLVNALTLSGMSADEIVAMLKPDQDGRLWAGHLTPEEREWMLSQEQMSDEDIAKGVAELVEYGGPDLGEVIRELESELA